MHQFTTSQDPENSNKPETKVEPAQQEHMMEAKPIVRGLQLQVFTNFADNSWVFNPSCT